MRKEIQDILQKYDPENIIKTESPTNEYQDEAKFVAQLVSKIKTEKELFTIICGGWGRMFGLPLKSIEKLEAIAEEIWKLPQ